MNNHELIRFGSDQELAASVAWRLLAELEDRARPRFAIALSGGRIAGRLFSTITEMARGKAAIFKPVQWFWSDERCVPPEDSQSNFGMANKLLLRPLAVPETQVHRVHGEKAPQDAASAAEAETRSVLGAAHGQPVLDLVFLGMGEDGHIASLFPSEPETLVNDSAVYRAVTSPKPPPQRVTLGYQGIAAAREVWVLAAGPAKEQAFRESLRPGGRTPLARVLKLRAKTIIFTDIGAG